MKYPSEFTAEIKGFLSMAGLGSLSVPVTPVLRASCAIKLEALSSDATADSLM